MTGPDRCPDCQVENGAAHADGCGRRPAAEWTPAVADQVVGGGELIEAPRLDPVPARAPARLWAVLVGAVPSVWSEPPTAPSALVRYARDGEWCAPEAVGWRRVGQAYCVLVAIPASVVAYLLAWLVQRPGRVFAAGLLALIVWLVT